ncbi:MAG: DnaJ domain-containing protein [Nitrososphaerota archaeon]
MKLLEYGLSLISRIFGRMTDTQVLGITLAMIATALAGFVLVSTLTIFLKGVSWVRKSRHNVPSEVDEGLSRYYQVLGLVPGASQSEIKAAYRELVKRYHPDRIPHDLPSKVRAEMEEKMKCVNEAYKALLIHSPTPQLRLEPLNSLENVGHEIEYAESVLSRPDGGADALTHIHKAAENLVQILHKAACGRSAGGHYYDMLSDLLMSDVINLEEFELLSSIRRRWSDIRRGQTPNNREIAIVTRALSRTYTEIMKRYSG